MVSNNMQSKLGLKTITCEDGEKWTKVIVKLDLKMFNMKCFEDNIVALMKKCVVDMTGILGRTIKVELNGTKIPITSFTYMPIFS